MTDGDADNASLARARQSPPEEAPALQPFDDRPGGNDPDDHQEPSRAAVLRKWARGLIRQHRVLEEKYVVLRAKIAAKRARARERRYVRSWAGRTTRGAWRSAKLPLWAINAIEATAQARVSVRRQQTSMQLKRWLRRNGQNDAKLGWPIVCTAAKLDPDNPYLVNALHRLGPGRIAFVAADRKVKQRIVSAIPGAAVVAHQDYWVNAADDLAIHATAGRIVDQLTAAIARDAPLLAELLYQRLFTWAVSRLRAAYAIRNAIASGPDLIVIGESLDAISRLAATRLASRLTGSKFGAVDLALPATWKAPRRLPYGAQLTDRIAELREALDVLVLRRADIGSDLAERSQAARTRAARADAAPRRIAIAVESTASTKYWHGTTALLAARRNAGDPPPLLLTRYRYVADQADKGADRLVFRPRFANRLDPTFARAYRALLCAIEPLASTPPGSDPIEDAVRGELLARLADRSTMFLLMNEVRSVELLTDEFIARNVGAVVLMPHWSDLASITTAAARRIGAVVSSLPVVSVDGSIASLVGWSGLDAIGCYGTQCHEAFVKIGTDADRLHMVGSITLDSALRLSRDDVLARHPALRDFLDGSAGAILVATSAIDEHEIRWFEPLARKAATAGLRVMLRPHPSFGAAAYAAFVDAAGGPSQCRILAKEPLHDLIVLSTIVVTDFSTVGAEAVLMGRKLMVVNCTGTRYPANNYDEDGVAVLATTPDEVVARLGELIDDESLGQRLASRTKTFAERYNWMNDGRASHRFLELIEERMRAGAATRGKR